MTVSSFDTKSALQSKGVVGALITMVGANLHILLPLFGVEPELQDAITSLVVQAGGVLALYGRLSAKKGLH